MLLQSLRFSGNRPLVSVAGKSAGRPVSQTDAADAVQFSGGKARPVDVLSLGIEGPGKAAFYRYSYDQPLKKGEFDVETLYSGISAGTEGTFYKGTNPYKNRQWDNDLRLFRERQAEDKTLKPEKIIGYMEVGRVVRSKSDQVKKGEIVCMPYGHKTLHRASDSNYFVKLPQGVDPKVAVLVAQMGPICANGIAHADAYNQLDKVLKGEPVGNIQLGESLKGKKVAVFGAGIVGMLTALMAKHAGADVAIVDPMAQRLERAKQLGFTAVNGSGEPQNFIKEKLWYEPGNPGADVVFECTGFPAALHNAIAAAKKQANVLAIGFHQGGAADVRLGEEFHHSGINVKSTQIGNLLPGWDKKKLAEATVDFLRNPQFEKEAASLITHTVPFSKGPQAFAALWEKGQQHRISDFATDANNPNDLVQVVLKPDKPAELKALLEQAEAV